MILHDGGSVTDSKNVLQGQRKDSNAFSGAGHQSLSAALNGRNNSLGIIRLVLASAVIFSHAYPLGGYGADPLLAWSNQQESVGGLAVLAFFAISGYLITKSAAGNDVLQYAWHRILRIFPAYWCALVVGALVVAPAVWVAEGNSLRGFIHFGLGSPAAYLAANWRLKIGQYGVYDVFATTTPYGRFVNGSVLNGSIWTLDYEWMCYLIIGALLLLGVVKHARPLVPVVTALFVVLQVVQSTNPAWLATHLPYFADIYRITLPLTFLFGASLAVYSKKIPMADWLGVGCGAIAAVTLFTGGFALVGHPATVYFVLWLAARLPRGLQRIGRDNDYSYGIYVYGFLAEQLIAYLGVYRWGYFPFALLTLALTTACAWCSWHLVEKQALAWKGRGPGRGIRVLVATGAKGSKSMIRRCRRSVPGAADAGRRVLDEV